jgi:hypothetical protein
MLWPRKSGGFARAVDVALTRTKRAGAHQGASAGREDRTGGSAPRSAAHTHLMEINDPFSDPQCCAAPLAEVGRYDTEIYRM